MANGLVSNSSILAGRTETRGLHGALLMVGGLGVVATSVLYAVSPPDVLPTPSLDVTAAMMSTLKGAARMRAAGSIGVASDIITTMGIVLVLLNIGRARHGAATAGWAALLLSVVVFTLVDTMFGFVLVPLGADHAAAQAFVGAKRLFDAMFLVGTAALGIGLVAIMTGGTREPGPRLARGARLGGALVGAMALVCAVGSFAGLFFQPGAGVSVLLSGALLVLIGDAIRRQAKVVEP